MTKRPGSISSTRAQRAFYTRPTLQVAQDLLGAYLVRKTSKGFLEGKIVEVEAYLGPEDKASHAYNGKKTPRNQAEWMEGGHVYIYLVYGMYWQLNISTFKEGSPECVLIRALDREGAFGPGRLCRSLELDKSFYGEDMTTSPRIWIEDRGERVSIQAGPRVGIDYAGSYWARRKLRFSIKEYEPKLAKVKSVWIKRT